MNASQPSEVDAQDQFVRERIASQLDQNFLVEAAAGTGKTTSLVNRMVALVATGRCTVDQIAAITFTRKAAAELRERFQGELRALALESQRSSIGQELNLEERQRVSIAADQVNQAFVGTIHSFCTAMLRERPIEFAVDPAFRELEANEDLSLRQQAWQENLADLIAVNDPLMQQLQDLNVPRSQLKACFDQFIEFRDIEDWPSAVPPEVNIDQIQAATRDYIDHMRNLASQFPKDRGTDVMMNKYETIVRASGRNWTRLGNFFDLLEKFDSSPKVTQKCWPKIEGRSNPGKEEAQRWDQFRREIVEPSLLYWRRKRYRFVVDFLRRAVRVYERIKAASGGLDFQDLLLTVTKGLRRQAELRSYFQARYRYLLVDEFQDTDPIQAEMIMLLTSSDVGQSDWTRCTPNPGSLFLVGDPKQSIYRFRRGDIVTYNRVKEIVMRSSGEVLPLVKNFRSRPSLVEWNNRVYQQLFGTSSKYSPVSEDMLVGRSDAISPSKPQKTLDGLYRLSLSVSNQERSDEIHIAEADSIARFIRQAIDNRLQIYRTPKDQRAGLTCDVSAGDFMIVPWGKKRIHFYIKALEQYGIAYEVSGGNSLSGNRQLAWLADCLRAIDDPQNPVAYLRLLRELFGFSDAELFQFKQAGGRFNFTIDVPEESSFPTLDDRATKLPTQIGQVASRLQSIAMTFRQFQSWMRSLPYSVAVTRIAEELGLLASAAAHAEGNMQVGAMLKAIQWLRERSWDFDSATDLISFLDEIIDAEDSDGCPALTPNSDVVRIMNLHKAKGLEAPIVFLADTAKRFAGDVRCHIDRAGNQPVGYMGITVQKNEWVTVEVATPDRWSHLQSEEQKYLDAEYHRLLYVATTRAANAIIVSIGKDHSNWSTLHKFLEEATELVVPLRSSIDKPDKVDSSSAVEVRHENERKLSEQLSPVTVSELEARWTDALQPSYELISAKKLGLRGKSRPEWEVSGDYGYQWGSALHELLEIHYKRPSAELRPIALRIAQEHGLEANRVEELISVSSSVVQSEVWRRARQAKRCFSELPISVYESQSSADSDFRRYVKSADTDSEWQNASDSNSQSARPYLIRGVIDLIFEEPEGWVIVDYKTDDITADELVEAIEYYTGQLAAYAHYWTQITGFHVKAVGLYFTRLNRFVEVEMR